MYQNLVRRFLPVRYDKAQEQRTIKFIKWLIDFENRVNNESQKRWETAESKIPKYLVQVERKIVKGTNKNDIHHQEDNPTNNAMFTKSYQK